MDLEILKNYLVNGKTMALLWVANINYSTIILETDRILYCRMTPTEIIKAACLEGGSSYDGRRLAVIYLTGSKKKVPIPVIPHEDVYAFPTQSPTAFDCNWIFFSHIRYLSTFSCPKETMTKSSITFNNGHHITLNESHYLLQKQMQRTALCIHRFRGRPIKS